MSTITTSAAEYMARRDEMAGHTARERRSHWANALAAIDQHRVTATTQERAEVAGLFLTADAQVAGDRRPAWVLELRAVAEEAVAALVSERVDAELRRCGYSEEEVAAYRAGLSGEVPAPAPQERTWLDVLQEAREEMASLWLELEEAGDYKAAELVQTGRALEATDRAISAGLGHDYSIPMTAGQLARSFGTL